jgi:hypothetical protein
MSGLYRIQAEKAFYYMSSREDIAYNSEYDCAVYEYIVDQVPRECRIEK